MMPKLYRISALQHLVVPTDESAGTEHEIITEQRPKDGGMTTSSRPPGGPAKAADRNGRTASRVMPRASDPSVRERIAVTVLAIDG
jgi:hypothetical protein